MNNEFLKRYTNKQLQNYTHEQLSYTYWFVFVYDRTQEDVLRAIKLNGGKYINRTITPEEKEEWMAGIKDALNLLDLQRIEWNTRLIGDFELIKISVSVKKWNRGDIPNVSDFIRILDNIQKIRGAWAIMSDTPQTPKQPMTTYQKWNDVEKIMHGITHTYARTVRAFYYTGNITLGTFHRLSEILYCRRHEL